MTESGEAVRRLQCFELWGGNGKVAHPVEVPGLLGWVCSTPFGRAMGGGDVHYLSVCSKGMVSRIALADVAGHGEQASSVAGRLREVLQRHTDNWDQSALMREINDAFRQGVAGVRYATALVLGFYSQTGELLFSNAGHLPALWYHADDGHWDWLEDCTPRAKQVAGLPLGLISGTSYSQTAVELGAADLLMLYTDGITESRNESGDELGQDGLMELARGLPLSPLSRPVEVGPALLGALKVFRGSAPQRDDETLVVLQRQAATEQER